MATIRSYTTIEQSKALAKILPLESADMRFCFNHTLNGRITGHYPMIGREPSLGTIPCWSLSALLNIIRKRIGYTLQTTYNKNPKVFMVCELGDKPYSITSLEYDNEIDACVEMIIKLKEHILL